MPGDDLHSQMTAYTIGQHCQFEHALFFSALHEQNSFIVDEQRWRHTRDFPKKMGPIPLRRGKRRSRLFQHARNQFDFLQ